MKNKISKYDIIAIISGLGIIAWIICDFYGGMILFLFGYGLIILPFVLLYAFSILDTIISLIRRGKHTSKIKLTVHGIVILFIISINVYHSDLFKSKRIMTATLNDDLYHHRLIFRENGNVKNQTNGIFGFSKTYYGKYRIENDLIIFTKTPYENDFIPDTLLIDNEQNALFIERDSKGDFRKKKEFLNHFEIE